MWHSFPAKQQRTQTIHETKQHRTSINKNSNQPLSITKNLPKNLNNRLSSVRPIKPSLTYGLAASTIPICVWTCPWIQTRTKKVKQEKSQQTKKDYLVQPTIHCNLENWHEKKIFEHNRQTRHQATPTKENMQHKHTKNQLLMRAKPKIHNWGNDTK